MRNRLIRIGFAALASAGVLAATTAPASAHSGWWTTTQVDQVTCLKAVQWKVDKLESLDHGHHILVQPCEAIPGVGWRATVHYSDR